MNEQTREHFQDSDKVNILLHEYDTLRQEILARTGHLYLVGGVCVALFVLLIILNVNWAIQVWQALIPLLTVVVISSWLISRDINKAAMKLRQLEKEVNDRAGENLLCWETRWGGAVTGYLSLKGLPDDEVAHVGISRLKIFWVKDRMQVVIAIISFLAAAFSIIPILKVVLNSGFIEMIKHLFGSVFSFGSFAFASEKGAPPYSYDMKPLFSALFTLGIFIAFFWAFYLSLHSKDSKQIQTAKDYTKLFGGVLIGSAKGFLGL